MSEMPVPDIAMVTAQDVYDFCHSDVGERIKHAYDSGKLYRERYLDDINIEVEFNFISEKDKWNDSFRKAKKWINNIEDNM